jgi:hypothetical protein
MTVMPYFGVNYVSFVFMSGKLDSLCYFLKFNFVNFFFFFWIVRLVEVVLMSRLPG